MTTEIPAGMTRCPRCLLALKYMRANHLDKCGAEVKDGNWSEPRARFIAREYLGRSDEEQDAMRALEIADVAASEARR